MRNIKYSIIIGTLNHLEDCLKPCLESIKTYTDLSNCEIIVVSNGSTDGTGDYVRSLGEPFKLLEFPDPLGYAKANNIGASQARGEYLVLLNNDTRLLEQETNIWLNMLEKPFEDSEVGITGPIKQKRPELDQAFIIFFCVMMHKKLFDKIGLNEDYEVGGGEDIEFCLEAEKLGYKLVQVPSTPTSQTDEYVIGKFPIYHKGEATVKELSGWNTIFHENINKVVAKYKQPLVEIVMPVYNAESTLKKAIDAVLSQTYKNWLLYIVNDGSTDNSPFLLNRYQGHPQILVLNQGNEGVSAARNNALFVLGGKELIAYCDSDDIWEPDHLDISVKTLLQNKVDLVYCNPLLRNESNQEMFTNIVWYDEFNVHNLKKANFIYISTVVHKGKIGFFDSKLDSLEDYDMWIQAVNKGYKFKQHADKTCTYTVKEKNMSSKGSEVLEALQEKNKEFFTTPVKLNLGCGEQILSGYINCDLHSPLAEEHFDAAKVPYPDNSVDEILAYHLIEHFDFRQGQEVLKEWYRVLKPGGRLHLETPDLLNSCKRFVEANEDFRIVLYGHFFAWPWQPGQAHLFLFTETQLIAELSWAGFKNMKRLAPDSTYAQCGNPPDLYLNMEAWK